MDTLDVFNQYVAPVNSIPFHASRVHKLYRINGELVKRTSSGDEVLDTVAITEALTNMWEWLLESCAKVILVGFNSSRFDNHVISHHTRLSCQPDLVDRVRSSVCCADFRTILQQQGIRGRLGALYSSSNGPPLELHDAVSDVSAIIHIMGSLKVSLDRLQSAGVSIKKYL